MNGICEIVEDVRRMEMFIRRLTKVHYYTERIDTNLSPQLITL